MPFRRRSANLSRKSRAVYAACEPLEQRRLLTQVINGTFQNSGAGAAYNDQTFFEYRQANGNKIIRISIVGNITAEFIGAHQYGAITTNTTSTYPESDLLSARPSSGLVLGDLEPAVNNTGTSSVFLFSIYIVHADMNSAISISQVPNFTVVDRPMTPFTAGQTIRILNATTGSINSSTFTGFIGSPDLSTSLALTDGGAYIGAQTTDTGQPTGNAGSDNIPLIWADQRAFGLRPASAGGMYAGLETAAGVSLGKFYLGGTITGIVDVAGSMDTFYAGQILTGNAQGIHSTFSAPLATTVATFLANTSLTVITPTPSNNFHIGGDIRNLISAHSFGTFATAAPADPEDMVYKTGFQLSVGGRVGQVRALDANMGFLGSATIQNSTKVTGPGSAQREVEYRSTAALVGDSSFFDPYFFGYDISIADATGSTSVAATRFNNNDTFANAQFLGTTYSSTLKDNTSIDLKGSLGNDGSLATDLADYFAIPLLAGQTIDVQLLDDYQGLSNTLHPRLGIFDPDGRLIASDYSNVNPYSQINKSIRITADRPAAYRIAIGQFGDANFSGAADTGEVMSRDNIQKNYRLQVRNVGNLAVGGIISNGSVGTMDLDGAGINVLRGDLGEVRSGVPAAALPGTGLTGTGIIFSESKPWSIPAGNLCAMEAVQMGAFEVASAVAGLVNDNLGSGPDFLVPYGAVGLLRTTATGTTTTAIMSVNDSTAAIVANPGPFPSSTDDLSLTPKSLAVGTNIQVVDCAGVLEGALLANRGIGVIRAAQIGGGTSYNGLGTATTLTVNPSSPIIQVNVDGVGKDGIIDLIDVTGNVNGAAIATGPGGNVRYMHVVGTAYRDQFFGAGVTEETVYTPGESVNVTDDSGTRAVLIPTPLNLNTVFPLPTNAKSEFLDPPMLTVLTYPVRDKSGEIIVRVTVNPMDDTSDNVARTGGGGLTVKTAGNGTAGTFEIGEITRAAATAATIPIGYAAGAAPAANTFTFLPYNRIYTQTPILAVTDTTPRDVNFIFRGDSTINVWNISDQLATDTITSISNQTSGEIVNIVPFTAAGALGANFPDVWTLEANTIGLAKSTTGAIVQGTLVLDTVFPYFNQRTLVRLNNVNSVHARAGLGNILANNIGSIVANSDRSNAKGFEGINAPVVSRGTTNLTGQIISVQIGEGVLSSGTGQMGKSGIYADGSIDLVSGSGATADIRGNIVAGQQTPYTSAQAIDLTTGAGLINPDGTPLMVTTPKYGIGSIVLKGGSIVDANILSGSVVAPAAGIAASAEGFGAIPTMTELALDSYDKPFYDIGSISLKGTGGIIGASITAPDIGSIVVSGGFGVLASALTMLNSGVAAGIVADGYGIRDVTLLSGAGLRQAIARGNGKNVSVTAYSTSVRLSETGTAFDPYSGRSLNAYTDLDKYLGTRATKTKISGVTDTGLIQDCRFVGSRDLGTVEAQRIVGKQVNVTNPITGKVSRIAYNAAAYPMAFSFANSTGSITIRDRIDGLSLSTGSMKKLVAGTDILSSFVKIGGHLELLQADNLRRSATFQINDVRWIAAKHELFSKVTIAQDTGSVSVGTNIGSSLLSFGRNLSTLSVNGSILSGSTVKVRKTLTKLFINGDIKKGATLSAHSITKQTINGQVSGSLLIV